MSDKLREDFEKEAQASVYIYDFERDARNPDNYYVTKTQIAWANYKAATERAARICYEKAVVQQEIFDTYKIESAKANCIALAGAAKEIRGE